MTVPDGFELTIGHGPAVDAWEPIYLRRGDDGVQLGTFVRECFCNNHGIAHGGAIAALADMAMGHAYAATFRANLGELRGLLTLQMALDFIAGAAIGRWLQFDTRVVLCGKSRGIIDCVATADGLYFWSQSLSCSRQSLFVIAYSARLKRSGISDSGAGMT